jgi:hypothetical protein
METRKTEAFRASLNSWKSQALALCNLEFSAAHFDFEQGTL